MTASETREELTSITESEREFLREAARSSLFILSKGILGYDKLNPVLHKEFCERIACAEQKRRLWLMPRAHLKSTIKTIAHNIQLVLRDPEHVRILINSETATQSYRFLSEIKRHWERNEVLKGLFPELVPPRLVGPGSDWSQHRATLNRVSVSGSAHWEAIGVGGAITGGHFTHINNDDIIGIEAYRSPARMQATKDWNDLLEPLLVDQHHDIIDWVGTRWSINDIYKHIMDFYGTTMEVYTRSAIENGEIIFPELHTAAEYKLLQDNNPALWHSQYENNPLNSDYKDLPYDSLLPYFLTPDMQQAIVLNADGSETRYSIREMDRVITVDPNSGSPLAPDTAAIIVSGVTHDDNLFALDTWSDRANPEAFVEQIYRMTDRWRPRMVGIEKAGQQNTQFYFEKLCRERKLYVNVVALEPKGRNKEERIRFSLQPRIATGKVFLLAGQEILRQQIREFPNNLIVDELDAFAYAPEIIRKPQNWDKRSLKRKHSLLGLVMRTRSPVTGY